MITTILRETPSRTDTYALKPGALEHVGTAAESEKGMINISKEATENLKSKVKGQIVLPSDPSYDEVRQIWNAMIDRRPALIVRCAEASDVPHAISFARENGLEISIRGGGHNIAGSALCDSGVMIDLSTMRRVRVDAEKKRAYVEPGALQGRKLIEPLLGFGTPHGEHIGAQPYAQWQKAFDPLLTPGARTTGNPIISWSSLKAR